MIVALPCIGSCRESFLATRPVVVQQISFGPVDGSEYLPEVADDAAQQRSLMRLMGKGLRIAEPSLSGAVGAAIGLLGGPPGAVIGGFAGGVISTAVKKLCFEMGSRSMGPREHARVGAVCALGAAEIVERITAGEKVREDGFFDEDKAGRSDAEEVWESLLSRCQREASERKLPYMGHLFASLAFEESVGLDMAHLCISEAERLSYRQLCILKIFAAEDSLGLRSENYRRELEDLSSFPRELYLILHESFDLYMRELIILEGFNPAPSIVHIKPEAMRTHGLGMDIHGLMQLSRIPGDDVAVIVEQLRRQIV